MSRPQGYAKVVGSPGQSARASGLSRVLLILSAVLLSLGYLLGIAFPLFRPSAPVAGLLLLILAALLVSMMNAASRRMSAYIKGARGEERVGTELARLPAGFTVFHGVSTRGGASPKSPDIDHVVLGPTGISVVETKNWSGAVSVRDGRILLEGSEPSRPPLDQVKAAASFIKSYFKSTYDLDVQVAPVICFVSSNLEGGVQGVEGVRVCGPDQLVAVIQDPLEDGSAALETDPRIEAWLAARVEGA